MYIYIDIELSKNLSIEENEYKDRVARNGKNIQLLTSAKLSKIQKCSSVT